MQTVTVSAPPSKSLSHRALMAAALAGGVSRLSHVLESDDTARTRDVFAALGARFTRMGPGEFAVNGLDGRVNSQPRGRTDAPEPLSCYVGESGTTCRLIAAILAAGRGSFRIHGAGRMHERPLADLAATLQSLGAIIRFEEKPGCPPLVLEARGLDASALPGGMADIGCDESSQYLSGLLLAAPLGHQELTIRLTGGKVVSWPYISLTLETMERFGVGFAVQSLDGEGWNDVDWRTLTRAEPYKLRFCVKPGPYRPGTHAVEGDWSGASYFLAAGAIGPKAVRVLGLNRASLQGDAALVGILEAMGARLDWDAEAAAITVFPSALRGVDVDMGHCPDLVPTVAALAAHADGRTTIRNVAHLKIKESDRLQAPAEILRKVGCTVETSADGLVIDPPAGGPRSPAEQTPFPAHNDHRIAMSASLLGLPGQGESGGFAVPLDDPACVAKSFPHFWDLWEQVKS